MRYGVIASISCGRLIPSVRHVMSRIFVLNLSRAFGAMDLCLMTPPAYRSGISVRHAVGSHSVGARGKPRAVHAGRGDTNRRGGSDGRLGPRITSRATTPFGGRLIWREYRHRRGSLNL